jgi:hypothetical protein
MVSEANGDAELVIETVLGDMTLPMVMVSQSPRWYSSYFGLDIRNSEVIHVMKQKFL